MRTRLCWRLSSSAAPRSSARSGALQRRVGPAVARGACRTRLLVVCSASNTLLELDLATGARPQGVCPQTSMRYTSCCMWWSRTAHAPLDGVPGRTLLLLKPASGPQCLASSRLLKMCLLCNEQARLLAAAVMCCPRWPGSVLTPVSLSGCAQRLSFSLHTRQASAHDCGALPILRTACSRTQRPCRERYMDAPHTSRPRAQRTHAAHCAAAAGAVVRSVRLTQPRRRRSGPGGPVTAEERAAAAQDSKRECWPTCIAISPYDGHVYVCQYKARGAARRREGAQPPGPRLPRKRAGVSMCMCADAAAGRAACALSRAVAARARWGLRARAAAGSPEGRCAPPAEAHLRPATAACDTASAVRGALLCARARAAGQRLRTAGSPLQKRCTLRRLLKLERPQWLLHGG